MSKIWALIKAYWYIPLGLILIVLAFIAGKGKLSDLGKLFKDASEQHKAEIKAIDRINDKKEKEKQDANQRALDALDTIEKKYEEDNQELDKKEKKRIQKLLDTAKDDPDEMDRLVEEMTGFEVITVDDA